MADPGCNDVIAVSYIVYIVDRRPVRHMEWPYARLAKRNGPRRYTRTEGSGIFSLAMLVATSAQFQKETARP